VHYAAVMAIRTGRDTSTDRQPLGLNVVNTMADIVIRHSQAKYHQLLFDNFFTSISLIQSLSEKGVRCVRTISDNRSGGASKTLLSKTGMKKKELGFFDYCCGVQIFMLKWQDNSTVTIASNSYTHMPVQSVRRYVTKSQSYEQVSQPNLINLYNNGMGGVDVMDRVQQPTYTESEKVVVAFVSKCGISPFLLRTWRVHTQLHSAHSISHLDFRERQHCVC